MSLQSPSPSPRNPKPRLGANLSGLKAFFSEPKAFIPLRRAPKYPSRKKLQGVRNGKSGGLVEKGGGKTHETLYVSA
jgi:hypothetical protein